MIKNSRSVQENQKAKREREREGMEEGILLLTEKGFWMALRMRSLSFSSLLICPPVLLSLTKTMASHLRPLDPPSPVEILP